MTGSTLTHAPGAARRADGTRANLYLLLEGGRPGAGGARYALSGVTEVHLGRGPARAATRASGAEGTLLRLEVPDSWMSSKHARLLRVMGAWVLEDQGSKNGTLRNGEKVDRAELRDGDLLLLGRTALLFRAAEPCPEGAAADLESAALLDQPLAVRTLSPALEPELRRLAEVAASPVPVVVTGESGTGKEIAARAVHALSGRTGAFVAVNAAALPRSLLEAQLFGHKKGAFTGAEQDKEGLLRASHQGTFFLDEVGDLPLEAQPALLRVLQEREVTPVGGSKAVPVDLRVVSATHRDLEAMVKAGSFREDLYARLRGFALRLPPLRERQCDLGLVVAAVLDRLVTGPAPLTLTAEAVQALAQWTWPMNARELEQCLSAAIALAKDGQVKLEHLPEDVRTNKPPPGAKGATPALSPEDQALREELVTLLRAHQGNISAVARAMGKARMQIQRWVKRFGLDPTAFHLGA